MSPTGMRRITQPDAFNIAPIVRVGRRPLICVGGVRILIAVSDSRYVRLPGNNRQYGEETTDKRQSPPATYKRLEHPCRQESYARGPQKNTCARQYERYSLAL